MFWEKLSLHDSKSIDAKTFYTIDKSSDVSVGYCDHLPQGKNLQKSPLNLQGRIKSCFSSRCEGKKRSRFFFFEANPKKFFGTKVQVFGCWQAGKSFLYIVSYIDQAKAIKAIAGLLIRPWRLRGDFWRFFPEEGGHSYQPKRRKICRWCQKFWHLSICCRAVKVFLKTSCTQIVRSLKKIL